MEITTAEFISSRVHLNEMPQDGKAEYAFIGRSNVGKSSLINKLLNKTLAKTSQSPGKTQTINHFLVNDHFYVVDLPGYGYAKVSHSLRDGFEVMIEKYLNQRETLMNIFILIDIRHEPLKTDIEFMNLLAEWELPFSIIFTKSDKLSKAQLHKSYKTYEKYLLETWEELPPMFITSAQTGTGKDEVWNYINEMNMIFESQNLN